MILAWNRGKPHRCPLCYAVAISSEKPSRWAVYTCCRCGSRFTRWPTLWRFLRDAGVACTEHYTVREGVLDEMKYRFLDHHAYPPKPPVPLEALAYIWAVLSSQPGGITHTELPPDTSVPRSSHPEGPS